METALLILSDKGARGERVDTSGPLLEEWLTARRVRVAERLMIPDDRETIRETLTRWCDSGRFSLILTCGGTGVSPRDVTPDATMEVAERLIPGFGEAMRAASLARTPHAMISRAVAGIRNGTLIINLPGSPRGAIENLEAIWGGVPHAVAKIRGDQQECGSLPVDATGGKRGETGQKEHES